MYLFTKRILDRDHNLDEITTLFSKAIINTKKYHQQSPAHRKELLHQKEQAAKRLVYFHLPFHPNHPPLDIKRVWKCLILKPSGKLQFNHTASQ